MKKKWIALMIIIASLCFACACGGNGDGTSSSAGSQETSSESGVNGGAMEGDNELDWNTLQE